MKFLKKYKQVIALIIFVSIGIIFSYFYISNLILPLQNELHELATNQTYAQQVANQYSQVANQTTQIFQSPATWIIVTPIVLLLDYIIAIAILSRRD